MRMETLVKQRFEELEKKAVALLAGRKLDFRTGEGEELYKVDSAGFNAWGTGVLSLLQRVFGEDSVQYEQFRKHFEAGQVHGTYLGTFENCRAVLQAAREDYEGGYLFNVRGLIQAEVSDDVLQQATELLQAKYTGPACVVAEVALEMTLKELCARKGITPARLDRMNADLGKAGVYNMGMQKQVAAWAERRNRGAHGEWNTFSEADVEDMIRGVTRLVAEYL
jgi:hypothetical protein